MFLNSDRIMTCFISWVDWFLFDIFCIDRWAIMLCLLCRVANSKFPLILNQRKNALSNKTQRNRVTIPNPL